MEPIAAHSSKFGEGPPRFPLQILLCLHFAACVVTSILIAPRFVLDSGRICIPRVLFLSGSATALAFALRRQTATTVIPIASKVIRASFRC